MCPLDSSFVWLHLFLELMVLKLCLIVASIAIESLLLLERLTSSPWLKISSQSRLLLHGISTITTVAVSSFLRLVRMLSRICLLVVTLSHNSGCLVSKPSLPSSVRSHNAVTNHHTTSTLTTRLNCAYVVLTPKSGHSHHRHKNSGCNLQIL